MSRHVCVTLSFVIAVVTAGLSGHAIETPGPRLCEVKDATGQMVRVPPQPARVLSLCTSATDTIIRLGEAFRLAGIDEYSRIVPGATNLPVLAKGSTISREQVIARQIDLAYIWWYQDDVAQVLASLRVPVIKLRCGRAIEVPAAIRLVGQSLGVPKAADALAQTVAEKLQCLHAPINLDAPRVYLELYSPFKTSGGDSYLNDLIQLAGGRNIAADAAASVLLSSERLLAADPQCVVLMAGFGTPEQFARRGGLASLSAVKTHRVYLLDRYCLVAGAGLPDGVAALRRLLNETSSNHL